MKHLQVFLAVMSLLMSYFPLENKVQLNTMNLTGWYLDLILEVQFPDPEKNYFAVLINAIVCKLC